MTDKEQKQLETAILQNQANFGISSAAKLELVMNLLNPVNENDEPQEPLITPEQARELLGFKDE